MYSESTPSAMRLGDYLMLLRRQWVAVLLGLALGLSLAGGYLFVAPREYTSQTSVLVTETTTGASGTSNRTNTINLDTEARLVTSTETVTAAADLLDLPSDRVGELADRVMVTVPPNTEILTISVVGSTAGEAQDGAEAFAEAYLDARRATAEAVLDAEYEALQGRIDAVSGQLEDVIAAGSQLAAGSPERARNDQQAASLNSQLATLGSQQNEVRASALSPGRVVTRAVLPSSPSSPDIPVVLGIGIALGLLLGLGVATLRHRADDCIRTADDLARRTDVSVITLLDQPLRAGEVAIAPPTSPDARAYARLRNVVTAELQQGARRVVLVAGVHGGGGPVAANLATSLARAGEDVFLLCADAFGGTAETLTGGRPADGLAEVLAGEREVDEVARQLPGVPSLRVLGPGRDPDRADSLLQTRGPRKLVDRLLERAAYVVIEAPSTAGGTDAQSLADVAELAVIVVEAGRTTAREVTDAVYQFQSMHRSVLGAVLGRSTGDGGAAPRRGAPTDRPGAPAVPAPEAGTDGPAGDGGSVRRRAVPAVPVGWPTPPSSTVR